MGNTADKLVLVWFLVECLCAGALFMTLLVATYRERVILPRSHRVNPWGGYRVLRWWAVLVLPALLVLPSMFVVGWLLVQSPAGGIWTVVYVGAVFGVLNITWRISVGREEVVE